MSWHTWGRNCDIMSWEDIQKLAPNSTALITLTLNALEITLTDWIRALCCGDTSDLEGDGIDPEKAKEVIALFDQLQAEFTKATEVDGTHLELAAEYSSEADGDDREIIEAGCFSVHGVHTLSPAGKKFEKQITEISWTESG